MKILILNSNPNENDIKFDGKLDSLEKHLQNSSKNESSGFIGRKVLRLQHLPLET